MGLNSAKRNQEEPLSFHIKYTDQQGSPELLQVDTDLNGFVLVGAFSTTVLNKQCQYGVDFLFGDNETEIPNLGEGLRVKGESWKLF